MQIEDSFGGVYESQWYSGQWFESNAMTVAVGAGAVVSNVNAALDWHGASIAGAVTRFDGITPLAGVTVRVHRNVGGQWPQVAGETTDAAGWYRAPALTAGTYKVHFEDPAGRYLPAWFTNAPNQGAATSLVLGTTQDVEEVDAALARDLAPPSIVGLRRIASNEFELAVGGMTGVTYWLRGAATVLPVGWTNAGPSFFATMPTNAASETRTNAAFLWRFQMGE
jgi:hypothetical protein